MIKHLTNMAYLFKLVSFGCKQCKQTLGSFTKGSLLEGYGMVPQAARGQRRTKPNRAGTDTAQGSWTAGLSDSFINMPPMTSNIPKRFLASVLLSINP